MGVTDGTVTGASEVVDHGSPIFRWHLIVLAEGYTKNQQTIFNADVAEFAKFLFSVVPFDELDIESAINISKINIESTEDGADDPITCGGTGVTKATFLDAKYCANGVLRRDLRVDAQLAK